MSDQTPSTPERPQPLTAADVTATIRDCLTAGRVVPTKHFRARGFLRDYTIRDVINVLAFGEVSSDAPQWNEHIQDWTYQVHGPDLEGDVLTVVAGIAADRLAVWLVTAY